MAVAVGEALASHGIRAVLTGGACAGIYSRGLFSSQDVDFVLEGRVDLSHLDAVMASLGFAREGDRYVHPESTIWVEFPRGPLGVGTDLAIHPVPLRSAGRTTLALSATDSCRDRLAAFYHWSDRQSLAAAVEIAHLNEVDLTRIRRWSQAEGHAARCEEFERELERRKRSR
ncbi:MAG TPA: hypothetical protein VLA66_03235 [Thermoanaerobaculia bacterium]|nr:hypothetical protein [Thermoanaerobaculia bacterium]